MGGPASQSKQEAKDVDLDVKVGTVVGFHGETLRGLDLTLSRRGGAIKSLAVSAKLGRDAAFNGDLRGRNGGRQVIYINAKDAGAFFRFTDLYGKIFGGEMCVAMDPHDRRDHARRTACSTSSDFSVRGEAALDRVVAGAPRRPASGRRFLAHAGRVHPLGRALLDPRRDRQRAHDRRHGRGLRSII